MDESKYTLTEKKVSSDTNHSQKRLISYLWKWGKFLELPHFQGEENLDGFPTKEMPISNRKTMCQDFPIGNSP